MRIRVGLALIALLFLLGQSNAATQLGATMQEVRVPGNADSLADALRKVADGGTIILVDDLKDRLVIRSPTKTITIEGEKPSIKLKGKRGRNVILFDIQAAKKVRLRNLELVGGETAVRAFDSVPLSVEGVRFTKNGTALDLTPGGGSKHYPVRITKTTFRGADIGIRASGVSLELREVTFRKNEKHMDIDAAESVEMVELRINGETGSSSSVLDRIERLEMRDVRIEKSKARAALHLKQIDNGKLDDVRFEKNEGIGLRASATNSLLVRKGVFADNVGVGFEADEVNSLEVHKARVEDNEVGVKVISSKAMIRKSRFKNILEVGVLGEAVKEGDLKVRDSEFVDMKVGVGTTSCNEGDGSCAHLLKANKFKRVGRPVFSYVGEPGPAPPPDVPSDLEK